MSKKLDSILSKVPSATITNEMMEQAIEKEEARVVVVEQTERIVAMIPTSVKRAIRLYLVDHPKETERTVILKGLKALGFHISDDELMDKRGYRL